MSSANVLLPSLKESTELYELTHNLEETVDYIKRLQKDKDDLHEIHKKCREKLIAEFAEIRETLDAREEKMLAELDSSFKSRDNKLATQLDMLENHKEKNEKTCEDCKETIATEDNTGKKAREAREVIIRKYCQSCIDESPVIQEVPIKLAHTFDRKKNILGEVTKFSVLRFDRIESGKHLPYTRLNSEVVHHVKTVRVKITSEQIPLMTLSSASIKYDRKTEGLTVDVRCKDATLDVGDDKEQAEALKEAYNDAKRQNMYVYIQAQESNDRKWEDWDNEEIAVKMCQKLSSAQQKGDKYTFYVNGEFHPGSFVHMRAKLVYLEDSSAIDEDGILDEDDVLKATPWSKQNKTSFGKAAAAAAEPQRVASPIAQEDEFGEMNENGFGEQEEVVYMEDTKHDDDNANGGGGGGNDGGNGVELVKMKIKCVMDIDGKDIKKSWVLSAKRDEIHYSSLLEKAKKVAKTKKVADFENKEYLFTVNGEQVTNENEFVQHCINADNPDNSDTLNIEMTGKIQ